MQKQIDQTIYGKQILVIKDHYHQKQNQKIRIQKKQQNLCLDKEYHSKEVEQEITSLLLISLIKNKDNQMN